MLKFKPYLRKTVDNSGMHRSADKKGRNRCAELINWMSDSLVEISDRILFREKPKNGFRSRFMQIGWKSIHVNPRLPIEIKLNQIFNPT